MNVKNGFDIELGILTNQTNTYEDKTNERMELTLSAPPLARSIASMPICRMCSSTILFSSRVAFGTRLTNLNRRARSIRDKMQWKSCHQNSHSRMSNLWNNICGGGRSIYLDAFHLVGALWLQHKLLRVDREWGPLPLFWSTPLMLMDANMIALDGLLHQDVERPTTNTHLALVVMIN